MGNSASRIDRFYGNYEKSFDRIEKDVVRLKAQASSRAASRASLRMWSSALVVVALAVAVGGIYQVQQQPPGTFTYQQHFNRVGGALALPAAALLLHWALGLALALAERRDAAKLARLEAAKRSMLKELRDMSRFDKIKTLIDKFDPDARPLPMPQHGGMMMGRGGRGGQQQQQYYQQQQSPSSALMKGSGQVAGAAALAVAGAGRALMPLVDRLATSLISDNPVLLEDLRCAQQQLQEAEVRTMGTVQENVAVKFENLDLKQRLVALEKQLDLPVSFEPEALAQEQAALAQQAQQTQAAVQQVAAQQVYMQQHQHQQQQQLGAAPLLLLGESSAASDPDGGQPGVTNTSSSSGGDNAGGVGGSGGAGKGST